MSIFNNQRLDPSIFGLDYEKAAKGYYTDKYFENGRFILERLTESGYIKKYMDVSVDIGSIEVEMQVFHRREPFSVIANTDYALSILARCAGKYMNNKFINNAEDLEILSLSDGEKVFPWMPVMRIRGVYQDFALLETLYLGVLSRGSKIATNTYNILKAAEGKGVLFFPARFDLPETQESDGYSYYIGLQRYNMDCGKNLQPLVSTDAQGAWWGGAGGGTVAHAFIICHLKDTAEAMLNFAKHLPSGISRIALVDTNNDCVGDSLRTVRALFKEYLKLMKDGKPDEAAKFKLFAVRLDTASNMTDKSLASSNRSDINQGVNPRLVKLVRDALDNGWSDIGLAGADGETARDFFRSVKIVASGGFDETKVRFFESAGAPVDFYGIGSYFFTAQSNDFTADIVKVKIGGKWIEMGKEGRLSRENDSLGSVKIKDGRIFEY